MTPRTLTPSRPIEHPELQAAVARFRELRSRVRKLNVEIDAAAAELRKAKEAHVPSNKDARLADALGTPLPVPKTVRAAAEALAKLQGDRDDATIELNRLEPTLKHLAARASLEISETFRDVIVARVRAYARGLRALIDGIEGMATLYGEAAALGFSADSAPHVNPNIGDKSQLRALLEEELRRIVELVPEVRSDDEQEPTAP